MRSRTEMVTTQLEGSEFEDESDFEDSEEDWQPAKGEAKVKKVKSPGRARKSSPGNKNGSAKKRGRKPVKKSKKKTSEDEEESDEELSAPEDIPVTKKPKMPKKVEPDVNTSFSANSPPAATATSSSSFSRLEPTTSALSPSVIKPQPLVRKMTTPQKSFPDKCGYLNLYIFKGDLKDGIVNNTQVCLWRRDGSSLLQKYLRDKTIDADIPQYNSSMVYSCWEDKRSDEYLEVKVRCLEQSKQVRVELTDVDELEAQSRSEYDSYVTTYGVPPVRSKQMPADDDDDDDDDDANMGEDDGDDEDGNGGMPEDDEEEDNDGEEDNEAAQEE